jgi:hypothetical protein
MTNLYLFRQLKQKPDIFQVFSLKYFINFNIVVFIESESKKRDEVLPRLFFHIVRLSIT